jgi:hypothetical protein
MRRRLSAPSDKRAAITKSHHRRRSHHIRSNHTRRNHLIRNQRSRNKILTNSFHLSKTAFFSAHKCQNAPSTV